MFVIIILLLLTILLKVNKNGNEVIASGGLVSAGTWTAISKRHNPLKIDVDTAVIARYLYIFIIFNCLVYLFHIYKFRFIYDRHIIFIYLLCVIFNSFF